MHNQSIAGKSFSARPFRLSNFGALWSAAAAANLADGIFKLALPLLATRLTDSPALVAGVAFAVRLPWLLFALLAGVLADRFDRRQMMIAANAIRFIVLTLVVVVSLLDAMSLPILYVIALVLGIAETLADTASSSILPSIVRSEDLEQANARLVGAHSTSSGSLYCLIQACRLLLLFPNSPAA